MNTTPRLRLSLLGGCALALAVSSATAQDWPQWRGPNRDARAASFNAPKTWPKELAQKWKVTVGDGVATPALVGDKLYVFSREEGNEVLRCLEAASGQELWQQKYEAQGASGPAQGFSGPRCTPTVADGKIVTLGVRGMLCCRNAADGKLLWQKDEFPGALPRFFTSASPIVADGLCVAQVGGGNNGGIVAYDLAGGTEKWKWTGDGPAYASPTLLTVNGAKYVVAQTDTKVVAIALADGKLAWETPFVVQGRGYNAATPIVDGQTVIYAGSSRGVTAVKLTKEGDKLEAKELWKNADNSVMFNSPVLRSGLLFGLSARNDFFCLNAQDGQSAWTAPLNPAAAGSEPPGQDRPPGDRPPGDRASGDRPPGDRPRGEGPGGGPGGRPGGRGMGGGRGMPGYGSIVDAGSVLVALTPASQLVAFEPNAKAYTELARIKVADSPTYAYPVLSGNRIFIKDQNSVALLALP